MQEEVLQMVSFEYEIKDVHGIHARPATDLFKMTKQYESVVKVAKGDKEVPFKGVMGIMSLGAKQGDTVKFSFDGADEAAEMEAVKAFVEANL
jgi:phosphocarrier protein